MLTSKPVPDKSGVKKTGKEDERFGFFERLLEKDCEVEVKMNAKYDPRKGA